jgi:hypothetical protein
MAIDFRRPPSITFDPTRGQVQTEFTSAIFNSRVVRAEVALNGFDITFNNGDHHLLREIIDASIDSVQDRTVRVKVNYLLRDDSGNIDDPYSGRVDVLVIAEVA